MVSISKGSVAICTVIIMGKTLVPAVGLASILWGQSGDLQVFKGYSANTDRK